MHLLNTLLLNIFSALKGTCFYSLFTYIHSVNLACVLNSLFCEMWFLEAFKILSILSNVLCVVLYGQYTTGFLNSINVLRDKTFNSVCALD